MTVRLIDTEIEIARLLAGLRVRRSREMGAVNTPYGDQTQDEMDINAMGGELAFCKLVNVYPDLTTMVKVKAADCRLGGYRVDVKTTKLENGRLISKITKNVEDVDLYVLMRGTLPLYEFGGWCLAEELIAAGSIQNINGVPTYVLPPEKVKGLDDLKMLLQTKPNHPIIDATRQQANQARS